MSPKTRRIFISYTHDDESFKKELEQHLAPMLLLKSAFAWSDRQMKPGAFLFEEIRENIERADIILLLISASYLASQSCQMEIAAALARQRNRQSIVIPVIVRPCAWTMLPLGHLLATPKDGRPVSTSPNRDVAWLNVVEDLRDLIADWTPVGEREVEEAAPASSQAENGDGKVADQKSQRHWVYRKSDNDDEWMQLKKRLAEAMAARLDDLLPPGQEDSVRIWGDKVLLDVKHPEFASTKRLIIDDISGAPGYPGYQLDIYPGAPLGLQVKAMNVRWLQDEAGSDFLSTTDGKTVLTLDGLASEIAKQAAETSWGRPARPTAGRSRNGG